jgi:integrase/recombinase XerD
MTRLRDKMKQEMVLRGFSAGTQDQYYRAVMKLHDYYRRSPAQLTEEEIKSFLLFVIQKEQCAASTYNVMIHGLKFFYKVVLKKVILALELPTRKEPQKLPDILSQQEVARIIKATFNLKHRSILIVAYGAGLRASEVASLRVGDIDSDRGCIHIREAKGRKDRYVPLSPVMLNTLRHYWKQCRLGLKKENDFIFPGTSGGALCPATIGAIYKHSKNLAGIKKDGGVHALRHAFATHALEAGADIYAIKQILGHSSMTSTVRYLRMTDKALQLVESPIERLGL